MSNAYDRIRYPSRIYAQTHPAAIGAVATLFGRKAAPSGASRVLEIGCGEGLNLIAMAQGAPGDEFVGADLAETAISAARETAALSGVTNVAFHALDLAAIDATFGDFDTIIAHGVYAWIPETARDALMRVIGERLKPGGLAFVSYNALPGSRFRQALRDMLLFATEGVDDPREKLDLARAFLSEQIETWSDTEADEIMLKSCANRILGNLPEVLYHDELSSDWAPELLSQVAARAAAHGLTYLCDADPKLSAEALCPSESFAAIRERAGGDWPRVEQLGDFRTLRAFRNSVFVSGDAADRRPLPARLRDLWACAELRIEDPDPHAADGALLVSPGGVKVRTNNAEFARLLIRLAEAYPVGVPLADVRELDSLAENLVRMFVSGIVQLRAAPPAVVRVPGDRPVASRLARTQAARGETALATLLHTMVMLDDATANAMIPLMDGSRTHAELRSEICRLTGFPTEEGARLLDELIAGLSRVALLAV